MERVQFEYVAYAFNRFQGRYVQIGITLSSSYYECKHSYELLCERINEFEYGTNKEWDFKDYHIKFRKIVHTDWEVIHD